MDDKKFETLNKHIWFLTTNLFRENPSSFFPEEAKIENGLIYNCSFGKLVHDFSSKSQIGITRLSTLIDDEGYTLMVNINRKDHDFGRKVYLFQDYESMSEKILRVKEYERGFWEKQILGEYYKRRHNLRHPPLKSQ